MCHLCKYNQIKSEECRMTQIWLLTIWGEMWQPNCENRGGKSREQSVQSQKYVHRTCSISQVNETFICGTVQYLLCSWFSISRSCKPHVRKHSGKIFTSKVMAKSSLNFHTVQLIRAILTCAKQLKQQQRSVIKGSRFMLWPPHPWLKVCDTIFVSGYTNKDIY